MNQKIGLFNTLILICCVFLANDNLFKQAKTLQRDGKYEETIVVFKAYLSQPMPENDFSNEQIDALVQLLNTFQSNGEAEACITILQEVFKVSISLFCCFKSKISRKPKKKG